MPAGECSEEDECEEGKDDGDDEEVGKYDGVFKCRCYPDKVEGVLVDRDAVCEGGCVVGADPGTTITVDADAEIANSHA